MKVHDQSCAFYVMNTSSNGDSVRKRGAIDIYGTTNLK